MLELLLTYDQNFFVSALGLEGSQKFDRIFLFTKFFNSLRAAENLS